MQKDKIVWVIFDTSHYYNLMIKLNELGISIYDNKRKDNNILIKTTLKDYKRIKKYLISYNVEIFAYDGLAKDIGLIKKYIFFIISIVVGILFLFLANNMVFKIVVNTPKANIESLVKNELKNNGIKPFTLKLRHKKIEKVVSKILNNNKDTLEWLEIKYDGLILIVNVTEKITKDLQEELPNCNIIASTDAKISSLNIFRGVALKDINDYVKKGEVILSGTISHNEEVKKTVCAKGEIYGEVWYKVKITLPFKEEYKEYTGKERYNLEVRLNDNKYQILKSRVKQSVKDNTNLYKLNDFEINLVKEKEYILKEKVLTEEEAYNKALAKAIEKINLKLDKDEKIILQKVLKKSVFDSTIYLEVFIVTKENIGVLQEVKENINDVQSNS